METDSRPRVLCVDDNRDVADSAGELLRLVGFNVRVCYDGPSALAVAEEFCPDVCLLDLNMPLMDGDALAVRLREQAGARPVLFVAVTAAEGADSRQRTMAVGFHLHLVKPVDPHKLLRVVDELWRVMNQTTNPSPKPGSAPLGEGSS
jgi:CheY-like chemotaxis protein